ncbi:MAG: hypothetical protein AAGA18_01495 [Verrucomicrobiota bacterium]
MSKIITVGLKHHRLFYHPYLLIVKATIVLNLPLSLTGPALAGDESFEVKSVTYRQTDSNPALYHSGLIKLYHQFLSVGANVHYFTHYVENQPGKKIASKGLLFQDHTGRHYFFSNELKRPKNISKVHLQEHGHLPTCSHASAANNMNTRTSLTYRKELLYEDLDTFTYH